MRKLIFITLMVIVTLSFHGCKSPGNQDHTERRDSANTSTELYYCPMHPEQTSDHADVCGICGMDMVKDENGTHQHLLDSIAFQK